MDNNILEMTNITKTFPGVKALDDVCLVVREGYIHALIGENGAGKSTLVKILNGVYQSDCGSIKLGGENIEIKDVNDAQKKGISIIFQEFNLINTLSVAENIFIGRYNGKKRIDWPIVEKKAKELLDNMGFKLDIKRKVETLSTAEKQLVEIAKALSYNAKIIVMDEPTSSLTNKEVDIFFPIINRLKQNGITVIYITHKLEEIFKICDFVTVMRDGKIVGENSVKNITRKEIIELMVGRSLEMEYPKRDIVPQENVLEVKNLSRGKQLKNISFTLRKGEILGIAGLVGAGRTELAEAIFGANPPDSGIIKIKGKRVHIRNTFEGKKNSIGMVTEDRKGNGLALPMNISENISISNLKDVSNGIIIDKKKELAITKQFIKKMNIKTPSAFQICSNLSGGNQQKVVLSKWLFLNSDILILDEPTRGIDVGSKYEIYCLMNSLLEQGKSIIMISSELPEVLGMSNRILVMHNGMIKGELAGKDMIATKVMQLAID